MFSGSFSESFTCSIVLLASECFRWFSTFRFCLPSGVFLKVLSVNTTLSLRLALGPCRSVLVYRGLVESVWPRAHFGLHYVSRTFDVSNLLRPLSECPRLSRAC